MGTKDITEKQLADYNDVFADIINGILFGGEQVVLEHELQNARDKSQYKFDNTIHEQERDLSKHWIPHRICFALFGFEHQTAAEPYTPMRVIGYDDASYRGQLTKQLPQRFPHCCRVFHQQAQKHGLYTQCTGDQACGCISETDAGTGGGRQIRGSAAHTAE